MHPLNKKIFIYSAQNDGFRSDAVYENPRMFEKLPPQGLSQYDEIILIGNWPKVEAALDKAGFTWRHADKDDDKEPSINQEGQDSPDGIPDDWKELSWPELKSLAEKFTENAVTSKATAKRVINEELDKRA